MRRTAVAVAALAGLVSVASPARAQPAKFTLEVSPRRASVDDTFYATVTIEVEGVTTVDRYWAPRFPGFDVIDVRTEQNPSMRIDPQKGRTLVTQELHRYELEPKHAGAFSIEPAKIRYKGLDYQTRGAYVVVSPGKASGIAVDHATAGTRAPDPTASGGIGAPGFVPPDPSTSDPIFIHPVVNKSSVVVGEQITVTWLLYTRKEILKVEPRAPQVETTWSDVLYEPGDFLRYHDTMVGRRPYQVVILSKRAIFPTKAGRLRIAPFRADIVSLGSLMGKPDHIRSRPVWVRVRPLPAGAPADFDDSYVGHFDISASADRAEVSAGESLTLTVKVTGSGAIRRLRPPRFQLESFTVRAPDDFEETIDTSASEVHGARTYQYWVTPQAGGPQTIPALELPYYDTESASYQVARTRPIPLLVKGDPGSVSRHTEGDPRDNVIQRDIRLVHTAAPRGSRLLPTMYRRWWFVPVMLLPLLVFIAVGAIDRLLRRLRRETSRARLRRARGNAKRRFRLAEIHLRGNRPTKFFGELARVIYEHLEERQGRALQALTRDELAEALRDAGFPRTTVERVIRELDTCDAARFSPVGASRDDMEKALGRIRELLRTIEAARLAEPDDEEAA